MDYSADGSKSGWPTSLAEYIGYQGEKTGDQSSSARMKVGSEHIAPNGFLQAAVVVALADMCCAPFAFLPEGVNFTTIELKVNLLGTARQGESVRCDGVMQHGGRTTQVWDGEVINESSGKKMALFRCTQLLLYPPAS